PQTGFLTGDYARCARKRARAEVRRRSKTPLRRWLPKGARTLSVAAREEWLQRRFSRNLLSPLTLCGSSYRARPRLYAQKSERGVRAAVWERVRRERPRGRRAAEQRDELAPFELSAHSITSSASSCNALGTSRPSALAVCKLMTNSNFVACNTGRSAGFAPLRI